MMRITICGLNELTQHGGAGVTHVLSILDPDWPEPEAFLAFDPHRRLELRFHDIIVPDPGAILPEPEHVARVLQFGREVIAAGPTAHLLVHCHAGVSRSTAATALLMTQADPARPPGDIFAEIARMRPRAWPNLRMLELGDTALGRANHPGGLLAGQVGAQYCRVLAADPQFGEYITDAGRGREVTLARSFAASGPAQRS
jgi:predicted protein tyrosine phosphatase